jgi:hypothetical protein
MKIPAFMAVGEFIEIICRLYDILASTLQAEPLGIVLDKRLTFAQQQVENGAMLTLYS